MKKLSKIVFNQAKALEREEMKQVFGGSVSNGYHFFLRCNQESSEGYVVNNCDSSTFIQYCGEDLSLAVCIETQY
jgi:natural product precursor